MSDEERRTRAGRERPSAPAAEANDLDVLLRDALEAERDAPDRVARAALEAEDAGKAEGGGRVFRRPAAAAAGAVLLAAALLLAPALVRRADGPSEAGTDPPTVADARPVRAAVPDRASLTNVGEVMVVRRSDGGAYLLRNREGPSHRSPSGGRIMITTGGRR